MKKVSKIVASLQPEYIVDHNGKKSAVILDIRTFERLVEGIEGLYMGMGLLSEKMAKNTEVEFAPAEFKDAEVEAGL
jgi:hypothetical protein